MKRPLGNLSSALGMGAREHVALVGGGGKSTLLLTLARELHERGLKVVTTTTTKMRIEEGNQAAGTVFLRPDGGWEEPLTGALEKYGHVFVCLETLASGKAAGIPKSVADAIFQTSRVSHVLVEADGAAGRPVKAPGPGEPVIPDSVTMVVAVMGLDALGAPRTEAGVFRIQRFESITGLKSGGKMTPEVLARLFTHPKGLFKGSPAEARRVAFLNKLDLLDERSTAYELAAAIMTSEGSLVEKVVLGSLLKKEYVISGEEQ
jgi:probable selenium-dependent hydroxylase accessory protein YqeC